MSTMGDRDRIRRHRSSSENSSHHSNQSSPDKSHRSDLRTGGKGSLTMMTYFLYDVSFSS